MRQFLFGRYSWPLVALGALVALACLASTVYINRLQADLARAVSHEAAAMEAADELQVQLRHLRFHSLVLVADRTEPRREMVQADLSGAEAALDSIHHTASDPDDVQLATQIATDYKLYRDELHLDRLPPVTGSLTDLVRWSDAHHMEALLTLCRQLADRQRDRMNGGLERSERQTAWAGRVLLSLGLLGVLAGLVSGYATARTFLRRVASLSVRVQAVHSRLDQEVGAMSVDARGPSEDLDLQLERIVGRVSAVCQRLQEQERDLLRAEQLAAVGQLAAGVAHEVRNPLTGVKLLLQAAVQPQQATPLTPQRLHLLLQEVARIERTVQGLVDFARPPSQERHTLDLRVIIADAVAVTQSRADVKPVGIQVHTASDPLAVSADRDQILSLLTNLLFNAIDAAPAGSEVNLTATTTADGKIQVDVTDTGPGIDPTVAERLFDPFATTKPTGTGLGLSLARRVARDHGGTLTAANRDSGGACFTLQLPSTESPDAEVARRR